LAINLIKIDSVIKNSLGERGKEKSKKTKDKGQKIE